MALNFHSSIGNAAYADLLRIAREESVSDLRGTVQRKTIAGKEYLYDAYRLGGKVTFRYLGEATAELNALIDRAEEIKREAAARRADRTRLVRTLRAEGYAGLDARTGSILAAFVQAGVFRLGGTLVGTIAFRLYEGELGVALGFEQMAQTGDLDIASFERLSLAIEDRVTDDLSSVLQGFEFDPAPSLDPGRTWRWRHASRAMDIEFLTPSFGDEGLRDLPALGVSAQSLLVQIPRPEAFAIHKLIVADRRRGGPEELKSRKDRAQAAFLVETLAETRPDELAEAYQDARSRGSKWRDRIDSSLERMPQTRAALEGLTD